MYQLFQKDGFDYFTDMMPALHNYITVDTPAFLSNENHILAMFNMCKAVSYKKNVLYKNNPSQYNYFLNITLLSIS